MSGCILQVMKPTLRNVEQFLKQIVADTAVLHKDMVEYLPPSGYLTGLARDIRQRDVMERVLSSFSFTLARSLLLSFPEPSV